MDGRISLILDGGACQVGVESSVIDATGEVPVILRPGGITPEMVERVLGHVRVDEHVMSPLREGDVARSPGMKYKHYAPKAKAVIFSGAPEHVVSAICRRYDEQTAKGERVAILGLDEHRYGDRTFISLGSENARRRRRQGCSPRCANWMNAGTWWRSARRWIRRASVWP